MPNHETWPHAAILAGLAVLLAWFFPNAPARDDEYLHFGSCGEPRNGTRMHIVAPGQLGAGFLAFG
jgi:hypothetical protein